MDYNAYGVDQSAAADLRKRQQMAQMIMNQSQSPMNQQPVAPGQFAVPMSPFQGMASLGQAYAGKTMQNNANSDYRYRMGIGTPGLMNLRPVEYA